MLHAFSAWVRRALASLPPWGWGVCAAMAVAGGAATTLAYQHAERLETQAIDARFNKEVGEAVEDLEDRLKSSEQLLFSAAAFMEQQPHLTQEQWLQFSRTIRLTEHFVGIRGLGYAPWQAGVGTGRAPITLLAPLDWTNRNAIGFDIWAEPARHSALSLARDSGASALTGPVNLRIGDPANHRLGVVLYVPVYRMGQARNTLTERQSALQGWALMSFVLPDFLSGVGQHVPGMALEVFDGEEVDVPHRLAEIRADLVAAHSTAEPFLQQARTIEFAQRQWTVRFTTLPHWQTGYGHRISKLYLLTGAGLTWAAVWLLGLMIGHRARALRLVQEATRALGTSEAKYKQLVEVQSDLIAVIGLDGTLRYVNTACARFLGHSPESLIGLCFYDLIWATESHLIREHIAQLLEGRPAGVAEHRMLDHRGHEHWIAWTCSLQESPSDAELQVHLVGRDLTDRYVLESRLKDREQRYRSLFENLQAGIALNEVILDDVGKVVDFRFLAVNEAFERITGWRARDILGKTIVELKLVSPEELPLWLKQFGRVALGKGNVQFERESKTFGRWLDIVAYRPAPMQFALVLLDVTQRHEALQALQAKAQAEAASQAKTQFLANMSHEIRTPLNAVLGCAQIGLREHADPGSSDLFKRIRDAGQHLLGVVNDILDFSKVESGKFEVDARPVELRPLLHSAIDMVRDRAQAKQLLLTCVVDDAVPDWLSLDAMRLEQILVNLLSNAVKFTDRGEVILSVRSAVDRLLIDVLDTGVGMSEEQMARVFKPFEQADKSTTRQYGGTGLGLTISANLARLLGGTLSVSSRREGGSQFTLNIPLLPAAPVAATQPAEVHDKTLSGLRILVVDDVEVNRLIIEDMLAYHGAEVVLASDGLQAVELVRSDPEARWDGILMDIQMPIMDGLEATRRLKALVPQVPIMALTAHAFKQERDRCLQAGMVDHISKPIDEATLIRTVAARCGGRNISLGQEMEATAEPLADAVKEASPAELDSLDWSGLLALYGKKPGLLQRALRSVIEHNQSTADKLREAAGREDWDTLVFVSHSLKGVAGNLRATPLRELAAQTEQEARQHLPAALLLSLRLADGLDHLLLVLKTRLDSMELPV